MLSPDSAGFAARLLVRGATRGMAVSGKAQDQPNLGKAVEPVVQLGQAFGGAFQARHAAHFTAQFCHPSVGGQH